ncbi:MAG: FAD-binding oxidoreductase [Carbonactinosporaceae bacterium]
MVTASDVANLTGRLHGEVVEPGDPDYDAARAVWNGMIDKRPALIARCRGTGDAVAAVNFARDSRLPLAVRGGGHNVAGMAVADGGLVVDLSPMRGVRVDPQRRTVRVEGGARLGDVDRETQVHGLATPTGVVSRTGVAGLTLSGGIGWLRRKYGMSCDNLVSAEVVTADGGVLTASPGEHAELFWGLQGGGGNFGVVTSFEFRLHRIGPQVMFCFVLYPGDRAADVVRSCDQYMTDAPDEVSPVAFLGRVPAAEMFPRQWQGHPFIAVAAMYAGGVADGERVLSPLRGLHEPIVDLSAAQPYVEAQQALDEEYPDGGRYYWKSTHLDGLGEEVDRLVAHADIAPSDLSTIDVWYQGGAMSRVGAADTAFGDRSAPILIAPEANWSHRHDDAANLDWARRCIEDLRRFSDRGGYLNFPGFLEEGDGLVRTAYGDNYQRLAAVKAAYDPANLFRLNQNIKPSQR